MDYETVSQQLRDGDVEAVFGCQYPRQEVIGPTETRDVHFGTVVDQHAPKHLSGSATSPLVYMDFDMNQTRLPPWRNVEEFVLTADQSGTEATFKYAEHEETQVTGNLKTVLLRAREVELGVDGDIIR